MSRDNSSSVFMSSITDLMTSLAVIFILLLVFFIKKEYSEAARAEAATRSLETARKELETAKLSTKTIKEKLKARLADEGYPAEDDPQDALAVVYRAGGDELKFAVNSDMLQSDGRDYLDRFIPVLASVVADDEIYSALQSILIVGHTDSDADDEYNLELSQRRSFSVLRYSLNDCGLSNNERECLLDLASVNGRGERDLLPEGSEAGDEDKSESRRVEFKIRVKSFEEKDTEFMTSSEIPK